MSSAISRFIILLYKSNVNAIQCEKWAQLYKLQTYSLPELKTARKTKTAQNIVIIIPQCRSRLICYQHIESLFSIRLSINNVKMQLQIRPHMRITFAVYSVKLWFSFCFVLFLCLVTIILLSKTFFLISYHQLFVSLLFDIAVS